MAARRGARHATSVMHRGHVNELDITSDLQSPPLLLSLNIKYINRQYLMKLISTMGPEGLSKRVSL
jgi:hypothetical protein